MAPTKRTTIRVETKSLSVIRRAEASFDLWCEACGAVVPMFSAERAAEACRVTSREIYRRIETGAVHFVETEAGALFVCSSSLLAAPEPGAIATGSSGQG